MQVLNAEGGRQNIDQLNKMILENLSDEAPELRSLFDDLITVNNDEEHRHELAYDILKYIDTRQS